MYKHLKILIILGLLTAGSVAVAHSPSSSKASPPLPDEELSVIVSSRLIHSVEASEGYSYALYPAKNKSWALRVQYHCQQDNQQCRDAQVSNSYSLILKTEILSNKVAVDGCLRVGLQVSDGSDNKAPEYESLVLVSCNNMAGQSQYLMMKTKDESAERVLELDFINNIQLQN